MLKQKSGSLRNQIKARAEGAELQRTARVQLLASWWTSPEPQKGSLHLYPSSAQLRMPAREWEALRATSEASQEMTSQTCLRLAQHLVPMLLDRSPRVGQRLTERESPAFHGRGDVPTQSIPSKLICAQSPTWASPASNTFKILLIKILKKAHKIL